MNKYIVQGGAEKLSGKVKETAGNITNDDRLRAEGQVEQVKGGVRQGVGNAKDAAADAADYVKGQK
jgi:uncharacterized protein YjbJ (UPF0337 family)